MIKKVLLTLICIFSFMNFYKAECNYTELKNLNILASYVDKSVDYDETSNSFTLTLTNVQNELYIEIEQTKYYPENGIIRINNLEEGRNLRIEVLSSTSAECTLERLRVINVTVPYLNTFFGTNECIGHENLEVCSNRFLNYKITTNTFNKLIDNDFKTTEDNNENNEPDKEEPDTISFWDKVLDLLKVIWIPALLILVTCIITLPICNIIYRKIKHGL